MNNPNPNKSCEKTQCQLIAEYLQQGNSLTQMQALSLFNVYALSQRIGNLKHKGYDICSQLIQVDSGKHVSQYYLKEFEPVFRVQNKVVTNKKRKFAMTMTIYIAGVLHVEAAAYITDKLGKTKYGTSSSIKNQHCTIINSAKSSMQNMGNIFKDVVGKYGVACIALAFYENTSFNAEEQIDEQTYQISAAFFTPTISKFHTSYVTKEKYDDFDVNGVTPTDCRNMEEISGAKAVRFNHTNDGLPIFYMKDNRKLLLKDFTEMPVAKRSFFDRVFNRNKELAYD